MDRRPDQGVGGGPGELAFPLVNSTVLLSTLDCERLWGCGEHRGSWGRHRDSALSLPLFCKSQLVQYTVRIERDPWTVRVSHPTLRWTAAQGTIPQGVQRQPLALWGHTQGTCLKLLKTHRDPVPKHACLMLTGNKKAGTAEGQQPAARPAVACAHLGSDPPNGLGEKRGDKYCPQGAKCHTHGSWRPHPWGRKG